MIRCAASHGPRSTPVRTSERGAGTRQAPCRQASHISSQEASKATDSPASTRSPGPIGSSTQNSRASASTNAAAARWLTATPFGLPVDPEVKMIHASSSGPGRAGPPHRACRRSGERAAVGEHGDHPGLAEHQLGPLVRVVGVDRDVGGAGREHGQDRRRTARRCRRRCARRPGRRRRSRGRPAGAAGRRPRRPARGRSTARCRRRWPRPAGAGPRSRPARRAGCARRTRRRSGTRPAPVPRRGTDHRGGHRPPRTGARARAGHGAGTHRSPRRHGLRRGSGGRSVGRRAGAQRSCSQGKQQVTSASRGGVGLHRVEGAAQQPAQRLARG